MSLIAYPLYNSVDLVTVMYKTPDKPASIRRLYFVVRNAKIITVEPVLLLFMFARYLYSPLYEQYYYVRYGSAVLRNTSFPFPLNASYCLDSSEIDEYAGNGSYKIVEAHSSHLVMYGQLANRIPSIVITLLIGPLSDHFGRKPVIIAAGLGTSLQAAMAIIIVYYQLNPFYFIIANFFSGITGDFAGILAGSFSYVADVSSPKWRSLRIGIIEAVLALGGALGQFFGGYWLNKIDCDFLPPMWLNLACNIAAIVYSLFFLPESLNKEERRKNAAKNPKGYKAITQGVKIFVGRTSGQYPTWKLWVANIFVNMAIFNVVGSLLITVYFLKAFPFDFNALMIGIYQSVESISRALSNTVVLAVLVALKVPDALIALIGLGFSCSCNLLTGLSKKTYQIFTGIRKNTCNVTRICIV